MLAGLGLSPELVVWSRELREMRVASEWVPISQHSTSAAPRRLSTFILFFPGVYAKQDMDRAPQC